MNRLTEGAARVLRRAFGQPETELRPTTPCLGCGQQTIEVREFSVTPGPPPGWMDDDMVPRLALGARFAVVDGETVVLFDRSRAQSHVLNSTAALIWAEIDDQRTVAQIVDDLAASTGVDRGLVDHDVRATLTRLLDTHVVEQVPDLSLLVDESPEARSSVAEVGAEWTEPSPPDLDTIDWLAHFGPVEAGELSLIVRTNDLETGDALAAALAGLPLVPPTLGSPDPTELSLVDLGPDDPARFRLYVDGDRRWSDDDRALLLSAALEEITQLVIDGNPGDLLLHAGAVERDGRVVVVAGDSGQGKSTLTAALVQRGYRYLTDEVAAVEPGSLRVRPFAKPVDLDAQALELLGLVPQPRDRPTTGTVKSPVPVTTLGEVSPGGRLALVVMLLDVDPLDSASAPPSPAVRSVLELIGCTFGRSFDDPAVLEWLTEIAETVPFLRLPRGSLDDACARIEEALGDLA